MESSRSASGSTTWQEGADGTDPVYVERLWPPVIVAVMALGLAGIVGVAYSAAYGPAWGTAVGAAITILLVGALLATVVTLRVDERVVRAGRARLPLHVIADVAVLDGDAMREARRHGDPRDYLVLRAWSSRAGLALTLDDPQDPHPRWIVSTRHPDRLAAAITKARTPGR